jgi:hypothetical protein
VRKAVVVSLLALSLSIPAAPALAAQAHKGPSVSEPGHSKHAKPAKVRFVAAGQLVSVDAAGGTATFLVRGGKDKALRKQQLTVTVVSTTVVRRNGAVVPLADLVAGDHVNVSGLRTGTAYAALRVTAEGADIPTPIDTPTPAESPSPAETPSPAEAPTTTPTS